MEELRQARKYSQEFYEELLSEYHKSDDIPWEQVLELQEKRDLIEASLPYVSDEEFDEYIFLGDILAVLLEPVRK